MQCSSASHSEIRNLKITISYDGKELHGWQIQKNAITVQQRFQEAVQPIYEKYCGEYMDIINSILELGQ